MVINCATPKNGVPEPSEGCSWVFNHLYVSHFYPWNIIFTIYISAGYINSLESQEDLETLKQQPLSLKEEHHGQIWHVAQKMRASSKTSKETIFSSKISSIPRFFQGILQDTSILAIRNARNARSSEALRAALPCTGWGDVVNTGKLTDVRWSPPFDAFVNVRRLDFEHCSMFPKQRIGNQLGMIGYHSNFPVNKTSFLPIMLWFNCKKWKLDQKPWLSRKKVDFISENDGFFGQGGPI